MSKKSKGKFRRPRGAFPQTKQGWHDYEAQFIDWDRMREDHYYLDGKEAEIADMEEEMKDGRDEL